MGIPIMCVCVCVLCVYHDDDVEGGKDDRNDENSSCETTVQEEG